MGEQVNMGAVESSELSSIYSGADELAVGTQVRSPRETYTVQARLGAGLTAQVYRATRQSDGAVVALKVLRVGASTVSRDNFRGEAMTLATLAAEQVTCVPRMYDQQQPPAAPPHFIAMEYVDGARYRSLEDLSRQEPLAEVQGLALAVQGLALLHALHTRLEISYLDMQLKNFCWNGEELMVMDWNHVSPKRDVVEQRHAADLTAVTFEYLVRNDLARFGAYLYQVMTGKGALARGETQRVLERRAGEAWARVSVALRQVVVRALHPDLERRFQSAEDFLNAVKTVQELWTHEPADELVDEFKDELINAEAAAKLGPEQAAKLEALDEAAVNRYGERLKELTKGVSASWGVGELYYKAGQYVDAAQRWEAEAQAEGRAELWRWVMAAQTAARLGERYASVQAHVEQVVQALNADDLPLAQAHITHMRALQPMPEPAQSLDAEVQALNLMATARTSAETSDTAQQVNAWRRAAGTYRQVDRLLRRCIPLYYELVRDERGWERLAQDAEEMEVRANRRETIVQQCQEIRMALQQDFELGLERVQAALQADPTNLDMLTLCQQHVDDTVHSPKVPERYKRLQQALDLLDVVWLFGRPGTGSRDRLILQRDDCIKTMRRIEEARQEAKRVERYDELVRELRKVLGQGDWQRVVALATEIPGAARETEAHQNLLAELRAEFDSRCSQSSLEQARKIHDSLSLMESPQANHRTERQQRLDAVAATLSEEDRRLGAELQAKREEKGKLLDEVSRQQHLIDFLEWAAKQQQAINAKVGSTAATNLQPVITQVDQTLAQAVHDFPTLQGEPAYDAWRTALQDLRAGLQERFDNAGSTTGIVISCDKAMRDGLSALGELTPGGVQVAQEKVTMAQTLLKTAVVPEDPAVRRVGERVQELAGLIQQVQAHGLVEQAQQVQSKLESIDRQLHEMGSIRLEAALQEVRALYQQVQVGTYGPLFPVLVRQQLWIDRLAKLAELPTASEYGELKAVIRSTQALVTQLANRPSGVITFDDRPIQDKLQDTLDSVTDPIMVRLNVMDKKIDDLAAILQGRPIVPGDPKTIWSLFRRKGRNKQQGSGKLVEGELQPSATMDSSFEGQHASRSEEVKPPETEPALPRRAFRLPLFWIIPIVAVIFVVVIASAAIWALSIKTQNDRQAIAKLTADANSTHSALAQVTATVATSQLASATVTLPAIATATSEAEIAAGITPTVPTVITNTPLPPSPTATPLPPFEVQLVFSRVFNPTVPWYYDLPPLVMTLPLSWTVGGTNNVATATQPDGNIWMIELYINGALKPGITEMNASAPNQLGWRPDPNDAPLPAGTYSVSVHVIAQDNPRVVHDSVATQLEIRAPLRVKLLDPGGLRKELQLMGGDNQDYIPKDVTLDVLGKTVCKPDSSVCKSSSTITVLRVRPLAPKARSEVYWIPTGQGGVTSGPEAYVTTLDGDDNDLADKLEAVPTLNVSP
jgi:hypothetical protein